MKDLVNQTPSEIPYQHGMLDRLYTQVIAKAATMSKNPRMHKHALHMVLSTVVMVQEPLTISAVANLADIEEGKAEVLLHRLSSILLVEDDRPVRLYHPSFPDFIKDKARCQHSEYPGLARFLVVPSEVHIHLAHRCLRIMNDHLRKDICNIENPSLLNCEISDLDTKVAQATPRELRYACRFWPTHLRLGGGDRLSDGILSELTVFSKKHLLHWVEILSLMNEVFVVQHDIPPLLTYLNVRHLVKGI
jgi:hypothetical protein